MYIFNSFLGCLRRCHRPTVVLLTDDIADGLRTRGRNRPHVLPTLGPPKKRRAPTTTSSSSSSSSSDGGGGTGSRTHYCLVSRRGPQLLLGSKNSRLRRERERDDAKPRPFLPAVVVRGWRRRARYRRQARKIACQLVRRVTGIAHSIGRRGAAICALGCQHTGRGDRPHGRCGEKGGHPGTARRPRHSGW